MKRRCPSTWCMVCLCCCRGRSSRASRSSAKATRLHPRSIATSSSELSKGRAAAAAKLGCRHRLILQGFA